MHSHSINHDTAQQNTPLSPDKQHKENFHCRCINEDPDNRQRVLALRYLVYCQERNFLPAQNYPDGKESDEFDQYSHHFAAFDPSEQIAGAVRLVRHSRALKLPLQRYCTLFEDLPDHLKSIPLASTAEISRLVVSKDYRRRKNDNAYGGLAVDPSASVSVIDLAEERHKRHDRKSHDPEIVLGLYRSMYQKSKLEGITHWYAAMEKPLARLLMRCGFEFHPVGPEVDYYGPVAPYIACIADLEAWVASVDPERFRWFTTPDRE